MIERRIQVSFAVLAVAVAFAMATMAAEVDASVGRLDPSFGHGGQVGITDSSYQMTVGLDGSIALMNGFRKRASKYLPDGRPDPRFGDGGRMAFPTTIGGSPYELWDFAVDRRARMIVFGSVFPPGSPSVLVDPPWGIEYTQVSRALVMRFLPDGRLDPSFGERGVVISDFGLRSGFPSLNEPTTRSLAGVVDSDDRPLVLAGVAGRYSPCVGHGVIGPFPKAIVRLTPSGYPDPDFGGGDGISSELRHLNTFPPPVLSLTADDEPLAAGSEGSSCPQGILAFHLTANGDPSPAFGSGGRRYFRRTRFAVFAPSGEMILRQGFPPTERVLRVAPDGSIDRSLGGRHYSTVEMPAGTNQTLRPAAVDARGRVLMVGTYSRRAAEPDHKRAFVFVERLLRSGKPDLAFGRAGRISVAVPDAQVLGGNDVALDQSGRLVVFSGVKRPTEGRSAKAVLLRFRLDGRSE